MNKFSGFSCTNVQSQGLYIAKNSPAALAFCAVRSTTSDNRAGVNPEPMTAILIYWYTEFMTQWCMYGPEWEEVFITHAVTLLCRIANTKQHQ